MNNKIKGRLSKEFSQKALDIIQRKINGTHGQSPAFIELQHTLMIDLSHTLMLKKTALLEQHICDRLLTTQLELFDHKKIQELVLIPAPRGRYVVYEQFLINKLGIEVGGAVHFARSRNDINATLYKLQLRSAYKLTCQSILDIRKMLLEKAEQNFNTPFIIYSQFQPALPGTFGFYLAGIEQALSRMYKPVASVSEEINECPLGAGAGGGTEIPIDMYMTAELLGFKTVQYNALDCVASRDSAITLLSGLSNIAVLISRVAQDLQVWTTQECQLINLPDSIVGTSSMMPQKRNPYLLEKIKGKASRVFSALTSLINTSYKTPFSNSVEIGTESMSDFNKGLIEFSDAISLLQLIIEESDANLKSMDEIARKGAICATSIANELVREQNLSFRQAYHTVADAIRVALDQDKSPHEAITKLRQNTNWPIDWSKIANLQRFGGGPGSYSDYNRIEQLQNSLLKDQSNLDTVTKPWSETEKRIIDAVKSTI